MKSVHGEQVEKIKGLFNDLVVTIGSGTVMDLARKQDSIEKKIKSDIKEMEEIFNDEKLKNLNKDFAASTGELSE